jgi:hypothetical protein
MTPLRTEARRQQPGETGSAAVAGVAPIVFSERVGGALVVTLARAPVNAMRAASPSAISRLIAPFTSRRL